MSERLRRIFLCPPSRISLITCGRTSSPTPTASLPLKSTMTTSSVFRTSMFIRRNDTRPVMNLVLVFREDFASESRVVLRGRRAGHVREVHRAAVGDDLVVGL